MGGGSGSALTDGTPTVLGPLGVALGGEQCPGGKVMRPLTGLACTDDGGKGGGGGGDPGGPAAYLSASSSRVGVTGESIWISTKHTTVLRGS